jgi:hypothetical protein
MPVLRAQGLRFPRSVTFRSPPFWKPLLAHALGGFRAYPTDARFPAPYSCAATSCKIDIYVDNYMLYLIMKPPRPILKVMLQ